MTEGEEDELPGMTAGLGLYGMSDVGPASEQEEEEEEEDRLAAALTSEIEAQVPDLLALLVPYWYKSTNTDS